MPQPVNSKLLEERRIGIYHRLIKLKHTSSSILPGETICKLRRSLPTFFSHGFPQVLIHSDPSKTNILIHEKTLEFINIVD